MLIYDLSIDYGFGQIDINTYEGYLQAKTDIQGRFQLEKNDLEVDLQLEFPKIADIDLYQCRTDIGQPGLEAASLLWRDKAKTEVLEYIGQKSQSGDMLGAIENNVSITDIVEIESFPEPPELNVDVVPKTSPNITFNLGKVSVNLKQGGIKVDVTGKPVAFEYDRANVDILLEKNPYVKIEVVPKGNNIDKII